MNMHYADTYSCEYALFSVGLPLIGAWSCVSCRIACWRIVFYILCNTIAAFQLCESYNGPLAGFDF